MRENQKDHFNFRHANNPDASVEELIKLSDSNDELILSSLAINPNTPVDILNKLSKIDNNEINIALKTRALNMVHPTSIVSPRAVLGHNVKVGPYTIIHDNVVIGDETTIESNCEIGYQSHLSEGKPLVIGKSSLIRSHSIFYEGSTFGERLTTGHRVTVREKTDAGTNFQIGTLCDIQGNCTIGNYVRFHSNVHIGQHSRIGNYVWIFPYVVLTNDPHPPSDVMMGVAIEDFVAIATMSIVLPGVKVKKGALIGAHSSVSKDVEEDTVVAGAPAKVICATNEIKLKDGSNAPAYPWRKHFHRGYPENVVLEWLKELEV